MMFCWRIDSDPIMAFFWPTDSNPLLHVYAGWVLTKSKITTTEKRMNIYYYFHIIQNSNSSDLQIVVHIFDKAVLSGLIPVLVD